MSWGMIGCRTSPHEVVLDHSSEPSIAGQREGQINRHGGLSLGKLVDTFVVENVGDRIGIVSRRSESCVNGSQWVVICRWQTTSTFADSKCILSKHQTSQKQSKSDEASKRTRGASASGIISSSTLTPSQGSNSPNKPTFTVIVSVYCLLAVRD